MAILRPRQKIGNYEVKRLVEENLYCETYRIENKKEEPFFLKFLIIKNTSENLLTDLNKGIICQYLL